MRVGSRNLLAVLMLSVLAWLILSTQLPMRVTNVYVVISITTFLAYAVDKTAAKNNRWRISENTLHVLGLFGGWPGALLAQTLLRHKSAKRQFRLIFWMTVAMNLVVLSWLLSRWQSLH